ncbi:MAG: hypothetical protein SFU25_10190 [Candidatus Caenarcaniphilales bacterium]|nr:hypothetical protein [Candidatus Caenarcaniphilales bacterium]
MLIQRGKPIPEELLPINPSLISQFVDSIIPAKSLNLIKTKVIRMQPEWAYLDVNMRLNTLNMFYEDIFGSLCPKPTSKITFSRVRYTASFHSEDWSMRFSENFFVSNTFEQTFRTWLHESFHSFLHFSSLRLNPSVASDVFSPPSLILDTARKNPLKLDSSTLVLLAKRNLLGVLDRSLGQMNPVSSARSVRLGDDIFSVGSAGSSMTGTGLDSYYLNVEINVENLTDITFKKFFPYSTLKRSYARAEDYIRNRLNGMAPVYAAR